MEQPKGYVIQGSEEKVYKLHKALYGLKQAPRALFSRLETLFSRLESYFLRKGFQRSNYEQTLFIKKDEQGSILAVSMYVDDLMFTGNNERMMTVFKRSMKEEFDNTDLGKMHFFLGIEVVQKRDGIFICQKKYASEVLLRFGLNECNPVTNPMVPDQKLHKDETGNKVNETYFKQIIGSLMYFTAMRPDLVFTVSLLSRFMSCPTNLHLQVAKIILRYVRGTLNYGILYQKHETYDLIGYTDSDYAGDLGDMKSTSGYTFMLSGGAIAWSSKKQPIVALSSTQVEFVATAACAFQAVWMRRILEELGRQQKGNIVIFCDNSSMNNLSKNPMVHGRSKHIDVRFHFLRELSKEGVIDFQFCRSQDQVADLMTKSLKSKVFQGFRRDLVVCTISEVNQVQFKGGNVVQLRVSVKTVAWFACEVCQLLTVSIHWFSLVCHFLSFYFYMYKTHQF